MDIQPELMRYLQGAYTDPRFSDMDLTMFAAFCQRVDVDPRDWPHEYVLVWDEESDRARVHRTNASLAGEVDAYCKKQGFQITFKPEVKFYVPELVKGPGYPGSVLHVDPDVCAQYDAAEPGDIVCMVVLEDNEADKAYFEDYELRLTSEMDLMGGRDALTMQARVKARDRVRKQMGDNPGRRQTIGIGVLKGKQKHDMTSRRSLTRWNRAERLAQRWALRTRFEHALIDRDYGRVAGPGDDVQDLDPMPVEVSPA